MECAHVHPLTASTTAYPACSPLLHCLSLLFSHLKHVLGSPDNHLCDHQAMQVRDFLHCLGHLVMGAGGVDEGRERGREEGE